MTTDNSYERDKLYEEVWSEPVTAVAKRYGVSDVAIHKACKRLQVPVPPHGYWTRLGAGQSVTREPLPPYDGPQTVRRLSLAANRPRPTTTAKPKEQLVFLEEQERTKVLEFCDKLQVKDRLTNPHPLIKQDQEVRAEHKRKEKERKPLGYWSSESNSDHDFWSTWYKKILDIHVQPEDMPRAYRLLNAIFHAVEEQGTRLHPDDRGIPRASEELAGYKEKAVGERSGIIRDRPLGMCARAADAA